MAHSDDHDGPDDLSPAYARLFQAWMILVLLVLCMALLQYLLLKVTR